MKPVIRAIAAGWLLLASLRGGEAGAETPRQPSDSEVVQQSADTGTPLDRDSYRIDRTIVVRSRLWSAVRSRIVAARTIGGAMLDLAAGASLDGVDIDAARCARAVRISGSGAAIYDCRFTGGLGDGQKTIWLVDCDAGDDRDIADLELDDCEFATTLGAILVRGRVDTVRVSDCEFRDWTGQAILLRGTAANGPQDVTIRRCRFRQPRREGKGAKQAITAYSDPTGQRCNIGGLSIVNCRIEGLGIPYEQGGTGDQIVLQYCHDFRLAGVESIDGGENGIAVSAGCHRGTIAGCTVRGCDAHGLHLGSLGAETTGVNVVGCRFDNNALRQDGSADVMSGLYVQNCRDVNLGRVVIVDDRTPRQTRSGILVGQSQRVTGTIETDIADRVGFSPVSVFQSSGVSIEW